jgi:hypothetical protein
MMLRLNGHFFQGVIYMLVRTLLAVLLCLVTTLASADSVDIGFNNESFHLGYERPVVQDEFGVVSGNAGFLYNGDEKTTLGRVGADFVGSPGQYPGTRLGMGLRLYAGSTAKNTDFINLALGLRASYAPPQLGGFGVSASVYHAPKVFSFRDADNLTQSEIVLTYALVPKVRLNLGYYNLRLKEDSRGSNWTIDEGLRIGFTGYF